MQLNAGEASEFIRIPLWLWTGAPLNVSERLGVLNSSSGSSSSALQPAVLLVLARPGDPWLFSFIISVV